jgi:hypothetical protein
MPVEITEFDDFPEWMREQLQRGKATLIVDGKAATSEQFARVLQDVEDDEKPGQGEAGR